MRRPYDDPRWIALHSATYECPACGVRHEGLFDLTYHAPDAWGAALNARLNATVAQSDDSILTSRFCIIGGSRFFLLSDIDLPVIGAPGKHLTQSVWVALAKRDFTDYVEAYSSGRPSKGGHWNGLLANKMHGYVGTLDLPCTVTPRGLELRPCITIEDRTHALAEEQRDGVTFDRVLDLYAVNAHDLRAEYLGRG